jgi:hypothetical protein
MGMEQNMQKDWIWIIYKFQHDYCMVLMDVTSQNAGAGVAQSL